MELVELQESLGQLEYHLYSNTFETKGRVVELTRAAEFLI